MRLISAVLGFALRKLGLLAAVVLTLFVVYLVVQTLVPPLRQAVAERDRLEHVTAERAELEEDLGQLRREADEQRQEALDSLGSQVRDEVAAGQRSLSEKQDDVAHLREEREDVCGFWDKVVDAVTPGSACDTAEKALAAADATLDTVERNLGEAEDDLAVITDPDLTAEEKLDQLGEQGDPTLEREIDTKESELTQKKAEESSLRQARESGAGWVVDQWARSWKWLLVVALLVLVMPGLLRTVSYFLLMPVVKRIQKPILLAADAAGPDAAPTVLRASTARRTMTVDLAPGEVLSARSEHVRPVQGSVRSRLLYDWGAPFISFAAGLYGLSRVTGVDGDVVTSATLAAPGDPNSYLMRIDFENHPGVVMRPRHVVGVIGAPDLHPRWRWGIQALARWQVRYIMFAGTGSLIVEGSGDVSQMSPRGGSTRIEQHLVMGFDSRLTMTVNRTEVFWPYLWGRTPLVDDEFAGSEPLFWQKSTTEGPTNPITKVFDAFYSAVGKLLGF